MEAFNKIKLLCTMTAVLLPSLLFAQTMSYSVTVSPNAGSASQVDSDIAFSYGTTIGSGFENSALSCTQTQDGSDILYNIEYSGEDLDSDGFNDVVKFSLRVKGYTNSTYIYTAADAATSSVTTLGTAATVQSTNSFWGINNGTETTLNDIDAGETIQFTIESVTTTVGAPYVVELGGFSSLYINETNAGYGHKFISGFGNNLDAYNTNLDATISYSNEQTVYLTGAGSDATNNEKEWAVESISFSINVINEDNPYLWDPSDYSSFSPAYLLLDEYADHTKNTSFPEFSWDRVPRWLAFRSTKALSDELIETIAEHYQLVLLEKSNQQGLSSNEEGIESVASRLKSENQDIKTLFYWNSYIQYEGYNADAEFEANAWDWSQHTKDSTGTEVIYYFKDLYNVFNYDNADLREWWINTPLNMLKNSDNIDGVFIDKCGGFASGPTFDADSNFVNNQKKMVYELSQRMPEDKILVGNVLRNEWDNAGRSPMHYFDGSYLERWNFKNRNVSNTQPECDAIAMSIQLMREALLKGKMINFQTAMDYTDIAEDDADWEARAQDAVKFPLAVFLIVAEQNAYFSFQHGVNAIRENDVDVVWESSFVEEFNKPLGEPLGAPTKNGYLYTRSFEHLDVTVNLETEETTFDWKDPDTTTTALYEEENSTLEVTSKYNVYPNPVTDYFVIELPAVEKDVYTMFNIKGEVVSTGKLLEKSSTIDISGLESGVYLLKVNDERKFIFKSRNSSDK